MPKQNFFLVKIVKFVNHVNFSSGIKLTAKRLKDLRNLKSPECKRYAMKVLGCLGSSVRTSRTSTWKTIIPRSHWRLHFFSLECWTQNNLSGRSKIESAKTLFFESARLSTHFMFMLTLRTLEVDNLQVRLGRKPQKSINNAKNVLYFFLRRYI